MLDTPKNRRDSQNSSTIGNEEAIAFRKSHNIFNSDAKILLNAYRKALAATNNETLKNGLDFEEIKQFITEYQTNTLNKELFEKIIFNETTPLATSNANDTLWPMVNANIDRLDSELKVDNFQEKYAQELKIAKASLITIGIAGLIGLSIFGLAQAFSSGADTLSSAPSNTSFK